MMASRSSADSAPSMSDVARLARVSMATVSNTLNQPDKVSASTKARVLKAIEQLGFVRNSAARSIAAGTSTTIGLVLADMGNTLFVDIARGAERQAQASGMSLLLANSDVDLQKQDSYLHLFDEARVAGIILAPLDDSLAEMEKVRRHGRPVVLVNDTGINTKSCSVVVDEQYGGYLATRHLIDSGRKRLAFVGSPRHFHAISDRYLGAQRAVTEAGDGVTLELVETAALNVRDGYAVGQELRSRAADARPDGVFAAADLLAVGCIQAMHGHNGIEVPRDVAVIGYDNNHFATETMVPVSTIAQPAEEMGQAATKLLLDEARREPGHAHRRVILQPRLIVRQSSASDSSAGGPTATTVEHDDTPH